MSAIMELQQAHDRRLPAEYWETESDRELTNLENQAAAFRLAESKLGIAKLALEMARDSVAKTDSDHLHDMIDSVCDMIHAIRQQASCEADKIDAEIDGELEGMK